MMRTLVLTPLILLLFVFTLPVIVNAANDDFGNLSKLSKHLGGTGNLSSLLERLPEFTDEISKNLSNQQYAVKNVCQEELKTLTWQLANETKVSQLSNRCLRQVEALAASGYTDIAQPIANENVTANDDDPGSDDESSSCMETAFFNTDCTPKITINDDSTVSFGDGTNTYEQTENGTFVDTETGEEFTLADVLDREGMPAEQADDHSGALDIIKNVLNSANPGYTNDPATGAASDSSSSFGDILSSIFGGSNSGGGGPLSSIMDVLSGVPGVSDILGGSGFPGGGNSGGGTTGGGTTGGGTTGGGVDYSNFDGTLSDFVGDIKVINPDGPNQIVWDADAKAGLSKTQADVKAVLNYVAERVDFPIHVTESWAPSNTHVSKSQHHVGKAFDLEGAQYTDEQRVTLTQVILSHPAVGGFGWYPGDKSFHFDTRSSKAYWSGPPGGPYISDNFRKFCSGGGGYSIHPMMCELVFTWASGGSVGNVVDGGATTKPSDS